MTVFEPTTFWDLLQQEDLRQYLLKHYKEDLSGDIVPDEDAIEAQILRCFNNLGPDSDCWSEKLTVLLGYWTELFAQRQKSPIQYPSHQCYWNTRFALAVMCNFSLMEKRISAWVFCQNCVRGYAVLVTHGDYSIKRVFEYLGIEFSDNDVIICPEAVGYYRLSKDIICQIATIFNLPIIGANDHYDPLDKDEAQTKDWLILTEEAEKRIRGTEGLLLHSFK